MYSYTIIIYNVNYKINERNLKILEYHKEKLLFEYYIRAGNN